MRGQIVKGIAGFYFVRSGEDIYRCRARGVFKKQGMKPAVGDEVEFTWEEGEDDGVVSELLPRRNSFIRPFVANVDMFLVVVAASRPDPVPRVLDKLLITAEQAETEAVICINKCDLERNGKTGKAAAENIEKLKETYSGLYSVICTSKDDEESLIRIRDAIKGKTAALAGPSGTGKSTLLNRLTREEQMETGKVSHKTKRGRHTTRHAELFFLDKAGTKIFDTPGFTSFDLPEIEAERIGELFPEIEKAAGKCRYDDCMHLAEPGCFVKNELEAGRISRSRYDSYCAFVKETRDRKQY